MKLDRVLGAVAPKETRYWSQCLPHCRSSLHHAARSHRQAAGHDYALSAANAAAIGRDSIAAKAEASQKRTWTDEQIEELTESKLAYIQSGRTHEKRLFGSLKVGDKLPRAVFGPHTGTSFLYGESCDAQDVMGLMHWPADQSPTPPQRSR